MQKHKIKSTYAYLRKCLVCFTIFCALPQCSASYNAVISKYFLNEMIMQLFFELIIIPISKMREMRYREILQPKSGRWKQQ